MPDISGRMKSQGYISPAPPKGAPREVRVFMAKTYGGLRKEKYPGEIPTNKQRAAKITWYQTKRKFGKKYPELFRKTRGSRTTPPDLIGKEPQIQRGTRIEYREHPELGKKVARQIAIDHIRKDSSEYSTSRQKHTMGCHRIPSTARAHKPYRHSMAGNSDIQAERVKAMSSGG